MHAHTTHPVAAPGSRRRRRRPLPPIDPPPARPFSAPFADLLAQARHGVNAALGELLNSYWPYFCACAARRLPEDIQGKVLPDDVVQQAMLNACETFETFRGQTSNTFASWLHQMVNHIILSLLRAYRQQRRDLARECSLDSAEGRQAYAIPDASSVEQALQAKDRHWVLDCALQRLPAPLRKVLFIRYEENLTNLALARRLKTSLIGARRRVSRALQALAEQLGKLGLSEI